jgi:hypothetical protein
MVTHRSRHSAGEGTVQVLRAAESS